MRVSRVHCHSRFIYLACIWHAGRVPWKQIEGTLDPVMEALHLCRIAAPEAYN